MRQLLIILIILSSCSNSAFLYHKKYKRKIIPEKQQHSRIYRPTPVPVPPVIPKPQPEKPKPKPEIVPEFVEVPVFRNSEDGTILGDVFSHCHERPFGGHSRATNVHETAHGIHSYLRNKYTNELGKRMNGFYCLKGRGVIIEEPRMRKSQINKFIPANLRSYRYSTYFVGQREWDDTPLYVYDEFVAYILGGMCAVEDAQQGRYPRHMVDEVSGCIDFSIYAIALCMAVKEHDPEYWENKPQLRNFTIWMLKQAEKTYLTGSKMRQFQSDGQEKLFKEFRISESAEPMRKFVQENLEGVWLSNNY